MTKVIKGEFEKLKDLNDEDVLLTYDTPLEVFNNEFNRMSGMDGDLFTYELEVANIPYDSNKDDDSEQRVSHEADDDIEYDPSDVAFTERLRPNFFNYKTMDHYTKKALWIYWIRGDDKAELTDEEFYDNEDEFRAKEQALRNKAIMEGLISNDESCNNGWRKWENHEITYHYHDEIEYENETHDERQELCETHELPMCNLRRFKMIRYSFGQDEEYVAVKEDKYDDLVRTSDDACRAYQEIFRMMDEGWLVTRAQ
nr:C2 calcium/lipid-binding domain, CaLB [Tanacetum cinerariifolium]